MAKPETKGGKKNDRSMQKKKRRSLMRYFKEMSAELKKVNWPTRKELVNLLSLCHSLSAAWTGCWPRD